MREQNTNQLNNKLGKKILLGQLGAFGDCLYATAIARQIKQDYPNCHLTWAIGSICQSILHNNPHVDHIWEIPISKHRDCLEIWSMFEEEAKKRQLNGDFDEIFLTQIHPNNYQNYDGTVRASIFRGYPKPITVPIAPVIYLTQKEIDNVQAFAEKYHLKKRSQVILFEFAPQSSQSFVTAEFALTVSKNLTKKLPGIAVILTSSQPFESNDPDIIDGSALTFRENAEISKYCHLLIGCSSGISWLCTSEWAKSLPTIQLLKKSQSYFASMKHDFNYFGLDSSKIIEMTECTEEHLTNLIVAFFTESFESTYQKYHEEITLNFNHYFSVLNENITTIEKYNISISNTLKRYGSESLFNLFSALLEQSNIKKNQLRTEINMLKNICDERLALIKKLHNVCEERLEVIHSLTEKDRINL